MSDIQIAHMDHSMKIIIKAKSIHYIITLFLLSLDNLNFALLLWNSATSQGKLGLLLSIGLSQNSTLIISIVQISPISIIQLAHWGLRRKHFWEKNKLLLKHCIFIIISIQWVTTLSLFKTHYFQFTHENGCSSWTIYSQSGMSDKSWITVWWRLKLLAYFWPNSIEIIKEHGG